MTLATVLARTLRAIAEHLDPQPPAIGTLSNADLDRLGFKPPPRKR